MRGFIQHPTAVSSIQRKKRFFPVKHGKRFIPSGWLRPKAVYDYAAFGEKYAPGTSVSVEQRYKYTGRERNATSGSMYYRYRTYFAGVGRFSSRDPIGYFEEYADYDPESSEFYPIHLISPNLYEYINNSPAVNTDPYGLKGPIKPGKIIGKILGPGYGKYCGSARVGPGKPIDSLDECCKKHDKATEKALNEHSECHKACDRKYPSFFGQFKARRKCKRKCDLDHRKARDAADDTLIKCLEDLDDDTCKWDKPPKDPKKAKKYKKSAKRFFKTARFFRKFRIP